MVGIGIQPLVHFQIAQGRHGADGKLGFILLNRVQSQIAEIDGRVDVSPAQAQPQHAAENAIAPALIQLPGLLQSFCADVVFDRYHEPSLLFGVSAQFFIFYYTISACFREADLV